MSHTLPDDLVQQDARPARALQRRCARCLALVTLAVVGCQHAMHVTTARIDQPDGFPAALTELEESADEPVPPTLLDTLARASWIANPEWKAEAAQHSDWTFGAGPIMPRRWTFATLATLPGRDETSSEAARVLVSQLRRVAAQNDTAGWNAAIALTYWNPREGAAFASELEATMLRAEAAPPIKDVTPTKPADSETKPSSESSATDPAKAKIAVPIVKKVPVAMPLRCAAAEAWCLALASQPGDVELLLAPAGRAAADESLSPPVRAELFRCLAHWIEPAAIPGLSESMIEVEQPDGSTVPAPIDLRRAAIDACLIHAWVRRGDVATRPAANSSPQARDSKPSSDAVRPEWSDATWPAMVHRARLDSSPSVRQTYGRWLAVSDCPDAFSRLKHQLQDAEIHVREDACISLGMLRSRAAFEELQTCSKRSDERLREAAARGLTSFGPAALAPLSRDTTSRVRLVVAEGLAAHATVESAVLLKPLLADVDPMVQVRAARATRTWPDLTAIPVLVQGLRVGALKTRDVCWRELSRRIDIPADFPIDGSDAERNDAVSRLIATHRLPTGFTEVAASPRDGGATDDLAREQEILRILKVLHTQPSDSPDALQARRLALEWTGRDLALIERRLAEHATPISPEFEADVLAALSPAYAGLVELDSRDIFHRRKGAQAIAQAGASATLSPFFVRRLCERMIREQDQSVWRSVMAAVQQDGTPDAARLAELAANHPWPDVRVLGCDYALRHGHASFASWLLPMFHDANRSVQYAAVRASGACHNPLVLDGTPAQNGVAAQPGLRALMTHPDARLRHAAVEAMARLGDEQGMNELARLGYSDSPEIREQAARAMGESGQTRFVEPLIRMGWTESHGPARKAALAALEELVPPENRPPQLGGVTSEDGKIRTWSAWQQRNGAAR
ncbi:MAG: HEAT repeat domain-containing protein [Planctomycetaceae bacterium]|nr:HEAT repeat domain-containing protein [Planctomycetaceae bacterium]